MKKYISILTLLFVSIAIIFESCKKAETLIDDGYNEWYSGGVQTVFDQGVGAFAHAFPKLSNRNSSIHEVGDAAFEAQFVSSPAIIRYGLGPVFNSNSCFSCHIGDGRGKAPNAGEQMVSMLFRVSVPGADEHGGPLSAPGFGGQLQQRSVYGVKAEAGVKISYTNQTYYFADSTAYQLQNPQYSLVDSYIPLPANILFSPRVAPPVFGLGLLEAIEEVDILKNADEQDANGDGISGKANYVWNVKEGKSSLGRFGWKAEAPTLLQQSAGAYNQDMGITNFLFPKESCEEQSQHDNLIDEYEVSDSLLYAVELYMKTLAVPARRNVDDVEVIKGKQVFMQAKCGSCHIPKMKTAVNVAFPELSNQTIFPYTDLLLHDMGDDLADDRPTFLANGYEWRTPPLWGIGLTQVVNGHNNFLHDGRARSLLEAVMWHGGEAEQSKNYIKNSTATDRAALIRFLESL